MPNTEMMLTWPREREGVPFNTAAWNRFVNFLNGQQYGRAILAANTAAVYVLEVDNPAGPLAIFGGGVFVIQQTFVWANLDLSLRGGHALLFWNAGNTNSANLYHSGTNDILKSDDALWIAGAIASGVTPGATPAGYLLLSNNPRWLSGGSFYVELDHAATADRVVTLQDLAGTVALLGAANAGGHLIFVDATYDIGAAGATRPRDLYLSSSVSIGTNPAAAGAVRLANNAAIAARNAANGADITLIGTVATDVITTGQSGTRHNLLGTVVASNIDPPTVDGQVTSESQCKGFYSGYVSGGVVADGVKHNFSSVTRNGAGDYTVTWNRAFANAFYNITLGYQATVNLHQRITAQTTTTTRIVHQTPAGVATDPDAFHIALLGTLS